MKLPKQTTTEIKKEEEILKPTKERTNDTPNKKLSTTIEEYNYRHGFYTPPSANQNTIKYTGDKIVFNEKKVNIAPPLKIKLMPILIFILIIALCSGGYYYYSLQQKKNTNVEDTPTEEVEETNNQLICTQKIETTDGGNGEVKYVFNFEDDYLKRYVKTSALNFNPDYIFIEGIKTSCAQVIDVAGYQQSCINEENLYTTEIAIDLTEFTEIDYKLSTDSYIKLKADYPIDTIRDDLKTILEEKEYECN